ncbi:hypothetical protein J8L85_08730 [Maribacter sp. MMG018]|uniref:OmpP1/FadL family transporter n=1 Tax=Maribacter sp. MMG018 TaxID=2822688 RepID=UPI001B360D0B|nr:hypothetical protein [Maribacter sp. MMG018]MBQ4914518.1 hypothetical protein [Maribacter sp. MMG018]
MMKINLKIIFFTLTVAVCSTAYSQSEALTSSPYSLYGLGVVNQASIGKSNGLGYSGLGLKNVGSINNLNPATFSLVPRNSFLYDVGLKGQFNEYSNNNDSESKTNFNFSNLAFAFPIGQGFGAGVSLIPYSEVGYSVVGVETNIEGSTDTFESTISGLGGLSDLKMNLGYQLNDNIRFGLSGSFLFGNIEENESFYISGSYFESSEKTNYSGFRLSTGLQFDLTDKITIGSTIQFPTNLSGKVTRNVIKTLDGAEVTVEDETVESVDDFTLPMEVGIGVGATVFNSWTISADYKKNYWTETDQEEAIGHYVDQNIYAIGLEYQKNATSYKYKDRIQYRLGYNYDDGNLSIGNKKIDGYNITGGIGIPLHSGRSSFLNLSYSFGNRGKIQNVVIKEQYHLLTLNLSLEDVWFVKRKIN